MKKYTFLHFKEIKLTYLLGVAAGLLLITDVDMAQAQNQTQAVSKRLDIVERQLKAVQRKVFTPGSKFPSQPETQAGGTIPVISDSNIKFADIEARLSQMESQLRQLTGRVEEGNFQVEKLNQKLDVMSRDYEFRFKELEVVNSGKDKPVAVEGAEKQAAIINDVADILPPGSEEQQYSYAQKLVATGQYVKAEKALSEFIKRYPKAPLAGNAQYWLGQTFYVRKMNTKATRAFLEGYNNYPKNAKAPAFLLKIGMSLNAMGEKQDACDAYRELETRFPGSVENKNVRPSEAKRAGCD